MSKVLGTHPVVVISSGKGLQPIWAVADCDVTQGRALLRRFGRLVKAVAAKRGVNVDSIFDLPRKLRVPGTLNHKYDPPLPTSAILNGGKPLTATTVDKHLRAAGIGEQDDDANAGDVVVSKPHTWSYAESLCGYAKTTVIRWKTDAPSAGRHQMLMSNLVRLACMWRHGCLPSEKELKLARRIVGNRHRELCDTGERRLVPRYEIESAWAWAIERVSAMTDSQVAAQLGRHTHPVSPDQFWSSRNVLRQIQQYARARRVGPYAMLGNCLALAISAVPPHVVLPPTVGSHASLNLFVALVGKSGDTKSASMSAARDLVIVDPVPVVSKPGSGEGLAKCFASVSKSTGQVGKTWNVLAQVAEVDTLISTGGRSGSTIMSELRYGWSGERLGFDYAGADKRIMLHEHRYRLCLTVGVQPMRARVIFDDVDAGTPQRFLWLPTNDPGRPRIPPDTPDPISLQTWPVPYVHGGIDNNAALAALLDMAPEPTNFAVLEIPEVAREAILDHAYNVLGDDDSIDPLDGHKLLLRLKVAAGLMALDGRRGSVTFEDWLLAGHLMDVSEATRQATQRAITARALEDNERRGQFEGLRADVAENVKEQKALARIAKFVLRKLEEAGNQLPRAELRRLLSSRGRPYYDTVEANLILESKIEKHPSRNKGPDGFIVYRIETEQ